MIESIDAYDRIEPDRSVLESIGRIDRSIGGRIDRTRSIESIGAFRVDQSSVTDADGG